MRNEFLGPAYTLLILQSSSSLVGSAIALIDFGNPSYPALFLPKVYTVPLSVKITLCSKPHATSVTVEALLGIEISIGTICTDSSVVPT